MQRTNAELSGRGPPLRLSRAPTASAYCSVRQPQSHAVALDPDRSTIDRDALPRPHGQSLQAYIRLLALTVCPRLMADPMCCRA